MSKGVGQVSRYADPRAHALRERYLAEFGGEEIPVPVESIAEDALGLHIEEVWDIDCSGMLVPAERRIVLNAHERVGGQNDAPLRRYRFTIAHEIGHWICHCVGRPAPATTYCRPVDLDESADRTVEREANVFAAELLMPAPAVRDAWAKFRDVDATAGHFDVSPTAMHWRLFAFGLLVEKPGQEPAA
jgi:hypothetical protein